MGETTEFVIKFLKKVQVALIAIVRNIRTYNGTEFVNQTLKNYYEDVGITHQTSIARTPHQNGVVERRIQILVEAARAMLIFSMAPFLLWQKLWQQLFQPPPSVVSPVLPVVVPIPADTTSTPSSTIINQDALSASTLSTTKETQALVIHQVVKEQQQGNQNAQFDNDPFINIFTLEPSSEESSSRDVIPSNLHQINQPFDYLRKWIKDHPLDNVTTGFNKTPTPNRCHVVLF
ncbi:retrovirus-related pol polyprotein from transposon TNT 1-94 [Tanacetum coccineum]